MTPEDFTAGLDQLRPLLNPKKHGELCPKDIAMALGASLPFLVRILRLSCNTPKHPVASFARDLVFSCKNIASELPASAQLDSFNQWGLCMSKLTGRATLSETVSVPKVFAAKPSTAQGQKRRTSILEEEGRPADEHSSTEDGDREFESEDAPHLKLAGGKGKAVATLAVRGGASYSLTKGLRSGSLAVILPSGPPRKAAKTQPGSVKDEPIPSINLLRKTPTTKPSRVSARVPSLTEHPTVTIKNKKHLVLKAHTYEKEEPVPIKAEELNAITQAAALPSYGCAQCSSSIQNQPCLFLGWGKRCNNCEAASKSLCTFRAALVQHYFTCKELAKCVEATPENVCTCINHTSAALHVFESSTNATANTAQLFWACFEELSEVCAHASSSEGWDALLGMVFEDRDFEDRVRAAISRLDLQVSFPLDIECKPSLPLDHRPFSPPAFTAIIQASSPSDSLVDGDEVQGELNELKSLPIRPVQGELATAA
ncbi:hypothetical protein IW261DRAFT_1570424 [Armillaria novae-zelandiae]|uniref:Uncharacterized protein n=1 Tax=Armillaria novae-zelandiae TaxID=153914 RepID=A0AA39NVU8_9AGAR|nr:hypothetical protein IW261DRAFT_1570424 [Armillaria novae-zelandiae]